MEEKYLGVCTGKELFAELEERINKYNESNKDIGGKASVQRFHTTEGECDQPLILAIYTPLMSRVHQHIQQAGVDSSSSF